MYILGDILAGFFGSWLIEKLPKPMQWGCAVIGGAVLIWAIVYLAMEWW